ELGLEGALGAPAARADRRVAQDEPVRPDAPGLLVLGVPPGVADVRGGHDDDLPAVSRVGQCLLVAGHARGEDGLTDGLAERAIGTTGEGASVLEHQECGLGGLVGTGAHGRASPSAAVVRPRRIVVRTRPVRVRPAKGVLWDKDWDAPGSTVTSAAGSTRTRLAGAPAPTARPWSARPAIRAGATDIRSTSAAQSIRPEATMTSWTTAKAVSRPSMPKAASGKACSLSCRACGAWSVATASIVPSASASRSAATSSSGRSGGLTLYTGS